MTILELPYPPSLNHYYRHVGGKVLISKAGRQYRADVRALVLARGVPRLEGPLMVLLVVHPPSRRHVQDVDNSLKAALDALQHAGLYANDRQICCLHVSRGPLHEGGLVHVCILAYQGEGAEHV